MAYKTTTSTEDSPPATSHDELRPLDWWAKLDVQAESLKSESSDTERQRPPVPVFVRLSRLIDPHAPASRRSDPDDDVIDLTDGATSTLPTRRWADSVGRPLYQIGLAALLSAAAIGAHSIGNGSEPPATVETVMGESAAPIEGGGAPISAAPEAQSSALVESLVLQQSGGDADLSIVGTASADGDEIRWTATVRNEGPTTAKGPVTVVHTMPSQLAFVSAAGTGWECRYDEQSSSIVCDLGEELATGQRRQLAVVTSDGGMGAGARIPSTMSVVAGSPDPKLDNNTINITAVSGHGDDGTDSDARSRSTGAATSDDDANTSAQTNSATTTSSDDSMGGDELPRTGSGLTIILSAAGLGLCLIGRRLTTWSSSAQQQLLGTGS